MKIVIVISIVALVFCIWLNTHSLSNDFIVEQNWKNYDGFSNVFKDVITFDKLNKLSGLRLNANDSILTPNGVFLGKIVEKKYQYTSSNSFITVLDTASQQATYIAK
jgi:hypothetical protein